MKSRERVIPAEILAMNATEARQESQRMLAEHDVLIEARDRAQKALDTWRERNSALQSHRTNLALRRSS